MFPPHDEIRIKRCGDGFETELCKDGVAHSKLFDLSNTYKRTLNHLLRQMQERAEK